MMIDDGHAVIDYTQEEPSEEFIELVTRRVVEKLSDKVIVRSPGKAVPQIAEKTDPRGFRRKKNRTDFCP